MAGSAMRAAESRISSGTSSRGAWKFQSLSQSHQVSLPIRPSALLRRETSRTPLQTHVFSKLNDPLGSSLSVFVSPYFHYRPQWVPVTNIVYERTDCYYDLHVPGAEHYLANGIISHNTGKSRACLEKVNWVCEKYPKTRYAMLRKTRRSLTQSGMITFEQRVLFNPRAVPFHGGDQEYRYPNGSVIGVAGLDDPGKLFSSEWDGLYVQQAEDLDESDWESLFRSLRAWTVPYQQVIGDCNPAAPSHWIKGRAASGKLTLLESRHEDNPELWDVERQVWTERGRVYLEDLDALTGARYRRLRLGQWAGAEGAVYEKTWDKAIHVIERREIPKEWPRYWAVDFGYTNPFTWGAYAEDPDGRLILYKEIYHTRVLVEDHAKRIIEVTKGEPNPKVIICDHDAEDRATLERHLGMTTKAAWKSVGPGIQAVESRLRKAGDGKPRLLYMKDSLVDLDPDLLAKHRPTSTVEEFESYVWDTSNNRKQGEEPLKKNDHSMDRDRYLVTYVDETGRKRPQLFPLSTAGLVQPSAYRMDSVVGSSGYNDDETIIDERGRRIKFSDWENRG